jgi:hypothetical protein
MEPFGHGMAIQKERERITDRVNREAWMLESVEPRSRGKLGEALVRRVLGSGDR